MMCLLVIVLMVKPISESLEACTVVESAYLLYLFITSKAACSVYIVLLVEQISLDNFHQITLSQTTVVACKENRLKQLVADTFIMF